MTSFMTSYDAIMSKKCIESRAKMDSLRKKTYKIGILVIIRRLILKILNCAFEPL